jgi:hypothetical protein
VIEFCFPNSELSSILFGIKKERESKLNWLYCSFMELLFVFSLCTCLCNCTESCIVLCKIAVSIYIPMTETKRIWSGGDAFPTGVWASWFGWRLWFCRMVHSCYWAKLSHPLWFLMTSSFRLKWELQTHLSSHQARNLVAGGRRGKVRPPKCFHKRLNCIVSSNFLEWFPTCRGKATWFHGNARDVHGPAVYPPAGAIILRQ